MKFLQTFCGFLFISSTLLAQTDVPQSVADLTDTSSLRDLLDDPAVTTRILQATLGNAGQGWRLLKGLQLTPVVLSPADGKAVVGLKYALKQSIDNADLSPKDGSATRGLSYAFDATGTLVPNESDNPENLLDTSLSYHFFDSRGGVLAKIGGQQFNELSQKLADIEDEAILDEEWRKVQGVLLATLSTQRVIDVSAHASRESGQSGKQHQTLFGAELALDIKPWNPASSLAKANIFDHPFALIRVLTGYDDSFQPRGSTFPTFLVAIDRVNPGADHPRAAVGDTSNFSRLRAEASMRTPIATSGETRYFVDLNYRWYNEINASESVRRAHLQTNHYYTAAITTSKGAFASYAHGKLPFGLENESTYQLGWHFKFD